MKNRPDRILLSLLAKRGITKKWSADPNPVASVCSECESLARDSTFMIPFRAFLNDSPIIEASCRSMLAQLALAAGVRWQDTPSILHPLSHRGWHIGRWLPTFLLISGPLGNLLKGTASPLNQRLRGKNSTSPLLSEARDVFHNNDFRLLRNGFAHWSFEWVDTPPEPQVKVVNPDTGKEEVKFTLRECEALHFLTAAVVEAIDTHLFK